MFGTEGCRGSQHGLRERNAGRDRLLPDGSCLVAQAELRGPELGEKFPVHVAVGFALFEMRQTGGIGVPGLFAAAAPFGDVVQEFQHCVPAGYAGVVFDQPDQTAPIASQEREREQRVGYPALARQMFEKRFRPFFRKTLVEQDGAFGRSAARDLDAAEAARRAGIGPQAVGNAFQGFPVPVQAGFEDGMTLAEIDPHRIAFGAGDSTETL